MCVQCRAIYAGWADTLCQHARTCSTCPLADSFQKILPFSAPASTLKDQPPAPLQLTYLCILWVPRYRSTQVLNIWQVCHLVARSSCMRTVGLAHVAGVRQL